MFKSGISMFLRSLSRGARDARKRTSELPLMPALVETLESRVLLAMPTVASSGVSNLTFTSVTALGDVTSDGGVEVTERGVVFALTSDNADPEIGGASTIQVASGTTGTGPYVVNLSGLAANSEYTLKFYAINADGTSYSSVETFTTLDLQGLVVTTTDDIEDSNDGVVSLREALALANSTIGADTITFGGAVFTDATPDTITLTNGQLSITDSVTITGTGAESLSISGNNSSRAFHVYSSLQSIAVTLTGMTVTGGNASLGGGIINFDENLTIEDCVITGNTATQKGGGLWSDGFNMNLTIRRTTFSGNSAGTDGGGIYVEDTGGLLLIEDCTISGNTASDDGGGIYLYDPDDAVTIRNTTVSGNTAVDRGGGIYFYSIDGTAPLTIENCTISGNQAASGGGVFLYEPDTPTTIQNTTIYNNTATVSGGGLVIGIATNTLNITNSILAGNNENGSPNDFRIQSNSGLGSIVNNVIESMPTGTLNTATTNTGNLLGIDLQLAPLADNGGLTQTHALLADSAARNAGNSALSLAEDQRGVLRGDPPDIGAFELSAPALADLESGSLYFAPGQAPTAVTSTLTVATDATIAGATVRISAGFQAGDTLNFTDTPNISGVYNAATGVLTLTGVDTAANYQAALRSITYGTSTQSPAARTVSFLVTDGVEESETLTRDVGGYAQLNGVQVVVFGTQLADNIHLESGGPMNVTVNGIVTSFDPLAVTSVAIFGYNGDDSIVIDSLPANVTIAYAYGMQGNDSIRVNAAVTNAVVLSGAAGNDLLLGGSGDDHLVGGVGNDWLNGGAGADFLEGNDGNDVYAFAAATVNEFDVIQELSDQGRDMLYFAAMSTAVTVNLQNQIVASMSQRLVKVLVDGQQDNLEDVTGSSVGDMITGNANANLLLGGGGNDVLNGMGGSDQLEGGEGHDVISGGSENDYVIGGNGDDILSGDAGNDILIGDEGDDVMAGGLGEDVYLFAAALANQTDTLTESSGSGIDTLSFESLTTAVNVNLTSENLLATMAGRIVKTSGVGVAAQFENVIGGSGNDIMAGNSASNLLRGNGGDDTLTGNGGDDILVGGQGNDTLIGSSGLNLLIGGSGADLLDGGSGDDLMLSGSYTHENDEGVMRALLAEWASGSPYVLRIDRLLGLNGSGLNAGFYFDASTVIDDGAADYLKGNAGEDWFLASTVADVLQDRALDEVFTQIDEF